MPDSSPQVPARQTRIWGRILLALVLLSSALPRLLLARLGHNSDMYWWQVVADLVRAGKNVYAETSHYNYGPVWFEILAALSWLQQHTAAALHVSGPETFHLYVTTFLSIVDIAIAALLARRFGVTAALFFAFCPVSVFISGFHGQFDNLAVLFGMLAWFMLRPASNGDASPTWPHTILAAVILGVSLATKHLLVFLPLWLLMSRRLLPRGRAALFAVIAYGVFALSFAPFAQSPAARAGIIQHVLSYRSQVSDAAPFVRIIDLIVPYTLLDLPSRLHPALPSGLVLLFAAAMLMTGWSVGRCRPREMFWDYLLALMVFSIAWAEQYLAIPVAACAVYRRYWAAWGYVLVATFVLILSPHYFGVLGGRDLLFDLFGNRPVLFYHATIWLLFLLARGTLLDLFRAIRTKCRNVVADSENQ